jgi:hypothetical protein
MQFGAFSVINLTTGGLYLKTVCIILTCNKHQGHGHIRNRRKNLDNRLMFTPNSL